MDGFDVHLQAVPTGRPMTALLTHEGLFSPMFRCFVHAQLRTRQEGFRTLGTLQREAFQQTHRGDVIQLSRRLTACGLG